MALRREAYMLVRLSSTSTTAPSLVLPLPKQVLKHDSCTTITVKQEGIKVSKINHPLRGCTSTFRTSFLPRMMKLLACKEYEQVGDNGCMYVSGGAPKCNVGEYKDERSSTRWQARGRGRPTPLSGNPATFWHV